MSSLERFRHFSEEHRLLHDGAKVLVAVSGGMDSMCLLDLLRRTGYHVQVAHINYGLRGEDSVADEDLVRAYCDRHDLQLHVLRPEMPGSGIQETARQIRYDWFEHLRTDLQLTHIATGHHKDDSLETFFVNIIRGTGIEGLTGIPFKREHIIRPLMCFSREEISRIVEMYEVPYRHDKSNDENYYLRNKLRNELVPLLKEVSPGFAERQQKNMENLRGQAELLHTVFEKLLNNQISIDGDKTTIRTKALAEYPNPGIVLHQLAKRSGFSHAQCDEAMQSHAPGTQFLSPTHVMTIDRDQIIISLRNYSPATALQLVIGDEAKTPLGTLSVSTVDDCELTPDPNIECIDAQRCSGAFRLRAWLPGDRFHPLGAPGSQKVQDFLTNQKVSRPDKERTLVLTQDDRIIWIVGRRIDESVKVTASTTSYLRLTWQPA